MKYENTCVVCKKQFVSQWRLATCGEKECREALGDTEEKRFFFDRVLKKEDGCWDWMGGCDKKGNPVANGIGGCVTTYKFAMRILKGVDVGKKRLTRSCGNPMCVNPDHFMDDEERFFSRMEPQENGCVLWTAAKDEDGYGIGWLNGKQGRVTRMLWEKERGPIPGGMQLCHECDCPSCCNLGHLFLGTAKMNSDDKREKGREARGEATNVAVLSVSNVVRAREMRKSGATFPEIVKALGLCVTEEAVSSAVYGATWKQVDWICQPAEKPKKK